jgi:hypothetical protein
MSDANKPLGIQHAKITGQDMRDHWGPIVDRIGDSISQYCPNCEAQAAEIERLRLEAEAHYDRGYYDGSTHPIVRHDALREALEAAPLIGRTENVNDFMARQNAWLNGPYRAALGQSK